MPTPCESCPLRLASTRLAATCRASAGRLPAASRMRAVADSSPSAVMVLAMAQAPVAFKVMAYSELVAQMNRRLRLGPPKHRLATGSGSSILPRSVPSRGEAGPPAQAVEQALGAFGEDLAAAQAAAIRADLEAADMARPALLMAGAGVGDVQQRFVGRERQPVGLDEIMGHALDGSTGGVDAVDM